MARKDNIDKYLVLVVVLSAAYFLYWIFFQNYLYSTFRSSYFDIGGYTYAMYLHVHGIMSYSNPLQYLVFFGHISPFLVLLTPVFALYQHPLTLFIIQEFFLALTTILVYLVIRSIFANRNLALVFAIAFLVNPGIRALGYFDFHPEAFIPFFYILSFYFYYKGKAKYFVVSYVFLLGIMEISYVVGAPLLVALLLYELAYNRKSIGLELHNYRHRLKIICIGIMLTTLAALFYHFSAGYIVESYANTSIYSIPPIARFVNFIGIQSVLLSSPGLIGSHLSGYVAILDIFGFLSVLLGFGIWSLINPLISIILYLPWLAGAAVIPWFAWFNEQYYAFAVGGSFVSSVLGLLSLPRYKSKISKLFNINLKDIGNFVNLNILIFAIIFSVVAIAFGINTTLLTFPPNTGVNLTQVNAGLSMIPQNAVVMAQPSLSVHLFFIRNLELPPIYGNFGAFLSNLTVYWTAPQYIVLDKNLSDYGDFSNSSFNLYNYMGKNYTVYYNSSGFYIYKRIV